VPESKRRSRYTPPPAKKAPKSKPWVPATMFALLICGIAVVVLNYLGLLPGDEADNAYLVLGLILITSGFVFATKLR